MLDRPRQVQLGWAAVCLGLFLLLTVAVADSWGWLVDLDEHGRSAREWALDDASLEGPLRAVERGFGAVGVLVLTLVIGLLLWLRGHYRAAAYAAGVMVATVVAFRLLKRVVDRERPAWQWTDWLHDTHAFPSGHASMIGAFGAVMVVLVVMLVRRAAVRRLLIALVSVLVVVVCLDRVLLGRHYPSDVVGGALLGVTLALVGLAVHNPLPRSHAQKADPLPEAIPSATHRLAVVLNPVKVEDVGQFQSIVEAMAAEAGWSAPTWHLTTVEDPGAGQAERAAVEGADLVIVCGGDGTVREVCAELAGTGIPVGIVPAGTGNLLARNLDLPLYMRAAIDIALTGQDRAIDMVAVSGDAMADTHFMVMAGMGFDAAIMEGVNASIKEKVGWLAYVVSALKSLMFPATKVEIAVDDGEPTTHRARTIVVGNVGYLQAGMPLLPDAAIDDGRLDVVILHPARFLSWIPLAYRVLAKRPRTDETINRMTGRTVRIRAATETPRQLDGDAIGPGKELRMECIHGRLLVRVPR